MRLSVIIPTLDEAAAIGPLLASLQPLRAAGGEVLVVDGGSRDATAAVAAPLADRVLASSPGRARQMNAGAAVAVGEVLWFVHADTRLPEGSPERLVAALAGGAAWGRFDLRIDGRPRLLRVVAALSNLRSRLTGIATGDQAIFVRRELFAAVGGYPDLPLMEDLALCRALRRHGRPACLRPPVVTSGRRWERHGVLRTIALMWRLRLAYALGADPARLARRYRDAR